MERPSFFDNSSSSSPLITSVTRAAVKTRQDEKNKPHDPPFLDPQVVLDQSETSVGNISLQLENIHLSALLDDNTTTPNTSHTSPNPPNVPSDLCLLQQISEGTNPHASQLVESLPPTSQLYEILTTNEYIPLLPPNAKLTISDRVHLSTIADPLLHSVPHSITSFYIKLLIAACYEHLNLDIPYEVQYVAKSDNKNSPYQQQLKAYGLDLLLTRADDETQSNHGFPLLNLPEFNSEGYQTIKLSLKLNNTQIAKRVLTTLLQTQIRNNEFLANISKKSGPQKHSYAAKTAERLPINPKPKIIPNSTPLNIAKFPCTRCLVTATILTTTKDKYTKPLTLKPRFKTAEEFAETLPTELRKTFNDIFTEITQGLPNHSERKACPFASQPEIRECFQRSAPNKTPIQSTRQTYKCVVEACKSCNLCAKCGRPRNINNERHHQQCSTNYKQCPARKTNECKEKTCNHPPHPIKSAWRSEEINIQADTKQLEKNNTNFHTGGRE